MTITTIRPGSDVTVGSVVINGAATGWQATSDNSDTSYVSASNFTSWPKALLRVAPVSGGLTAVGASQRILRVRLNARIRMNASSGGQAGSIQLAMRSPGSGRAGAQYDFWESMQYSDATTYTTRTGVWRTTPPRDFGSEWTVYAIEHCSAEVKWYQSAFSGINLRLAELYFDVEYRDRATVTAISITNPTQSTSPDVTWQFNPNFDGDPETAYQVKIFRADQYSAFGFNPDTAQSVWDSGVVVGNATKLTVGTSLLNGQTYAAWVRVAADFRGQKWWSTWSNSSPTTMLLTPLPTPTMIGKVSDNTPPFIRTRIDVQANWNLLQVQDSNFDSAFFGTGTWAALFGGGTLARVTTPVLQGTGAMSITKSGTGDMEFLTAGGLTGFRVKTGQSYTALASFRTAATARSCNVGIGWYDRTGAPLSNNYGTAVTDSTSAWIQANYTTTAPVGAVFGAAWVKVQSAAASEIHYVDKVLVGTNVLIGSGTSVGAAGTQQPVVAAKYDSGYWTGSAVTFTCANIPPAALLVAVTASGVTASTPTNVVTSTGGLTWTSRQENTTASTGDVSISTAYFAAGGSVDVTVTASQSQARTIVYAVTGHDETSFGGASAKASATTGTANVSLTTTRENSLVIVGIGDFNAVDGNARTWRNPGLVFTEDFYGRFGGGSEYFGHSIRPTVGAGTEGLTAPTGMAYGIAAIEIRGATVNNIQTTYTGWSNGGWIGTGSTVVERALVSTGQRNNAPAQLWSGGDWLKTTDGFYLPDGQTESYLTYDNTQRFDGEGSIRWSVNNSGNKLFMGWPGQPALIGAPQWPMLGIENTTYTFSLYARSSATFASSITLEGLDQFGAPVGSSANSGAFNILSSGWTQFSCTFTMPTNCLWVRATLNNGASATEVKVWVDGIQFCAGTSTDTIPQFGSGQAVQWEAIRGADLGEWLITDYEAGLIGSIFDNEAPPGVGVVYRAYNYLPATNTVPALSSPVTFYSTAQLAPPGRGIWVLRDPQDATLAMRVHVVEMSESQHEESSTVYPLRPTTWDQLSQRAVTTTDFIGGYDGSLKILVDTESEWFMLRQLLSRPRPLWLIFPDFGARYIRITDRSWARQTPRSNQQLPDSVWRREISVNFLESEAP
jgi:hypothetical protein